jgi:hypothetical protein
MGGARIMASKDPEKRKAADEKYYAKHKEAIRARRRELYHLNKPPPKPKKPKRTDEERLAYQREYYQKNREKCLALQKEFHEKNPDYTKQYYKENRERIRANAKVYYQNITEEQRKEKNKKQYEYLRKRFEQDPEKFRKERRDRKKALKAKDPERYNAQVNEWNKKQYKKAKEELWDCYVRQQLCKHTAVKRLAAKDIPQELVEAKRLQIQIRRMTDEKCN